MIKIYNIVVNFINYLALKDRGTMDVSYYMTNDHKETNELIEKLISQANQSSNAILSSIDSRLRKHIFIEETILFPKLPPEMVDDVKYLEKEHGEVFRLLGSITNCKNEKQLQQLAQQLLDLLREHNSYEESFIYDYYQNEEVGPLIEFADPPKLWQCKIPVDR